MILTCTNILRKTKVWRKCLVLLMECAEINGVSTVSLLYDLAGGSACRRGSCDLHCISPLISLWRPHLSSLVRQSDLCSRPVHTWIKLRSVFNLIWVCWNIRDSPGAKCWPRLHALPPAKSYSKLTVYVCMYAYIYIGRRVIEISGALTWPKPLMELIFNPLVNFGEARRVI